MKLIKRDADYAIRSVCYIAKKGEGRVTVPDLVKALRIPRPFLRKILQILSSKGVIISYKGKGGGFSVRRGYKDIRITDIIEAFQGPLQLNECLFRKSICPNVRTCPLKKKVDAIGKHVVSQLRAITVRDLIKPER